MYIINKIYFANLQDQTEERWKGGEKEKEEEERGRTRGLFAKLQQRQPNRRHVLSAPRQEKVYCTDSQTGNTCSPPPPPHPHQDKVYCTDRLTGNTCSPPPVKTRYTVQTAQPETRALRPPTGEVILYTVQTAQPETRALCPPSGEGL